MTLKVEYLVCEAIIKVSSEMKDPYDILSASTSIKIMPVMITCLLVTPAACIPSVKPVVDNRLSMTPYETFFAMNGSNNMKIEDSLINNWCCYIFAY